MKVLEEKSGFETLSGMACGPVGVDICVAEDTIECSDGTVLYVSAGWVSEAPDEINHYTSASPLIDILLGRNDTDAVDAIEKSKKLKGRYLTAEEEEIVFERLRLALIDCLNTLDRYHGIFGPDAFTTGWDYDAD